MKNFLKDLFGFSIGPIVGAIISFITIPITTYFIAPDEYGKVTMFTLLQSILSMVVCLGIDQSYTRFYNEEKNKKKLLLNSMILPIVLSLIIAILLIVFAGNVSYILFEDSSYTLPIYLLSVMIPLMIFERFLLLSVRMQEKSFQYSFQSILIKFIILVSTIIFIMFIRRDFLSIVYSAIIGQIVGDIIIILLNLKDFSFNIILFDKKLFNELLKFGLPLLIVAIIGWALNSMDKVFLRIYTTFEEIGYYNIAMKIANILLIVQTCFTSFWVPTAYRWYAQKEPKEKFNMVSDSITIIMSIIFMLILLFKNLLPLLISKSYERAIYIMPCLLFYPIMYTMSETTTLGITFSKKSYLNIIVSVVSIAVNLILNYLLIPKTGAVGAAIATGISYIVFFWARTLISRKLWNKMPINKYIYITIILFVAAMTNSMVKNIKIDTIVNLIGILLIILIYKNTIFYIINKMKSKPKMNILSKN